MEKNKSEEKREEWRKGVKESKEAERRVKEENNGEE
jgi:hypothetical protein